jgi:hypothetical protein
MAFDGIAPSPCFFDVSRVEFITALGYIGIEGSDVGFRYPGSLAGWRLLGLGCWIGVHIEQMLELQKPTAVVRY